MKEKDLILWARLKEEHKVSLELAKSKYPFTITMVEEQLKANIIIGDLSFQCVSSLCLHANVSTTDRVYNLFKSTL